MSRYIAQTADKKRWTGSQCFCNHSTLLDSVSWYVENTIFVGSCGSRGFQCLYILTGLIYLFLLFLFFLLYADGRINFFYVIVPTALFIIFKLLYIYYVVYITR